MNYLDVILPAITTVLIGVLVPLIMERITDSQQKAEKKASKTKCIGYSRSDNIAMSVMTGFSVLLVAAALACMILCIKYPEKFEATAKEIYMFAGLFVLCFAFAIFTIVWTISFTRKICYNETYITDIRPFAQKKKYLYSDITSVGNSIVMMYGPFPTRKGKLTIFFDDKCLKIPARMFGVSECLENLRKQRPDLEIPYCTVVNS